MKKLIHLAAVAVAILFISSCANQGATEKHRASVDKVFAMFSTGDATGVEEHIDANFVEHTPPPGMDIKGVEGFKSIIKMNHDGFPDLKLTILDYVENGDVVVVHYNYKGTNKGDMGPGMPATNKAVDCNGVDWLKFKGDKCTDHWGYFEESKMMTQLGLMPDPGAAHSETPPGDKAPAIADTTAKKGK